jgi:hypothetical protein
MTVPTISAVPTPPSRSASPSTFITDGNAFMNAMPLLQAEMNAQAEALDDLAAAADGAVAAALAGTKIGRASCRERVS